ncbi:MAG: glycosyltransferase [Ktedonobacteraceae bacterium]|nr:glycosyltransferase [Ktedonobacteraceae bacterium]
MSVCVSVVVPTFKRPDLLERCLAALVTQNFDPTMYEIIIVDDAGSQETRHQVEHWSQQMQPYGYTIRYLPVTVVPHGPAAARNLGWHAAAGKVIAFTDDDCMPDVDWLKVGVAAFADGIIGASGRIIVPLPDEPTDYEYNAAQLEQSEFATANCFYRRDALALVGGFDERFTAPWREDSDLFFTFLEREAKYVTVSDALVLHPVRPARWGICLHQQRKSMFNALLYKKHPHLYREKIQATPPWQYYSIVGALLLVLLGLVECANFLMVSGLGLWAYLTGHFCLQRLRYTSHAPYHIIEVLVTSLVIPPLAIAWRLRGAFTFRVFFL